MDTQDFDQNPPEVSSGEALPAETLEGQLAAVTAERDQLAAEKADLQDRMLRARAEFDNFRRRAERERSDFLQYAAGDMVLQILPVLDDFERALKTETTDREYAKGVELIYQRLAETLKKIGLEPIETIGKRFDPTEHQAVQRVETDESDDQTILDEYQKGYNFRGKLLRPAMVKVAVKPYAVNPVSKRDYYEVLGVGKDAGDPDIKGAYRRLALKHHPDRNPDDPSAEEKFKEASEAYSILSDPQKRAAYDRYGHAGLQGVGAQAGFNPDAFADFSDILGDFFGFGDLFGGGGGRRRNRPQRGEDVRYDLEIGFEEAVFGMAADIQVPRTEPCDRCGGSGSEPGSGPTRCPTCQGAGEIRYQQSFLSIRRTCNTCGGSGQIIRNACNQCKGQGYRQGRRTLKINIPPGVDDGTRLRLAHEGQPGGNGGPPGDLYVFLKVKAHAFFERHENDLHCTIPINIAQAALGAEIEAPTLESPHKLKIPEGTQAGAEFRLRGKGVPNLNGGGRGDLLVHIDVSIPTRLTREQRKLLEQLRESLPVDNAPAEKGLFDKVKDYFM